MHCTSSRRSASASRTIEDGSITTPMTPEDPSVITRALATEGIYVRGLQTRRATLEEAFLELTHRAEATEAVEA